MGASSSHSLPLRHVPTHTASDQRMALPSPFSMAYAPRSSNPFTHDGEFASSLETDARVNEHVDYLLRLRDPELRSSYSHFNNHNQTLSSLLSFSTLLTLYTLPYFSTLIANLILGSGGPADSVAMFIVIIAFDFIVWRTYFIHKNIAKKHAGFLPQASRTFLERFQKAIFLVLNSIVCYRHIFRTIEGQCDKDHQHLLHNKDCNPFETQGSIVTETSIMMMLLPIAYAISVRGAHMSFTMLLWSISVATLVFSMVYATAVNSVMFIFYYIMASLVILCDARKQSYFLFFTSKKLDEILQERERAADEQYAQELRHMIANVAHDLKTPLSSFVSGIDIIASIASDARRRELAKPASRGEDEDFIGSIMTCVAGMRNTNAFMLMTINRCIDYTKASKGVKLVPKHETVDLMETLFLPLNCMKDIQQRVRIKLQPLAEGICSHVITDRQWLQENVLCLLSNAVKYSHDGAVVVSLQLMPALSPVTPRSLVDDSLHGLGSLSTDGAVEGNHSQKHQRHSCLDYDCMDHLRVEVEDHGIGLSDEAMASLFSPFKQAQRLAGGTGLGLFSLAKRLEALEGRCGVQRRRDGAEGSLFWFEMPYRPDEMAADLARKRGEDASPSSLYTIVGGQDSGKVSERGSDKVSLGSRTADSSATMAMSWLAVDALPPAPEKTNEQVTCPPIAPPVPQESDGKLHVLVADDSPAILKMTSMMLRRHKHLVSTASNGAEAVKMVVDRWAEDGRGYDVVLMDLQMPVMDGLEATRRLRALEAARPLARSPDDVVEKGTSNCSDCESQTDGSSSAAQHRGVGRQLIIGVSANSDSETAHEAFNMGIDAFIAKPFTLETFYQTYERIVAISLA